MAVTTVTIPAVGKTTIKPRIPTVTTKTVMVVEGVQEVIAAVAIMAGVMDMEVEVAVVEAAEVTIVTILAEAMVGVCCVQFHYDIPLRTCRKRKLVSIGHTCT